MTTKQIQVLGQTVTVEMPDILLACPSCGDPVATVSSHARQSATTMPNQPKTPAREDSAMAEKTEQNQPVAPKSTLKERQAMFAAVRADMPNATVNEVIDEVRRRNNA